MKKIFCLLALFISSLIPAFAEGEAAPAKTFAEILAEARENALLEGDLYILSGKVVYEATPGRPQEHLANLLRIKQGDILFRSGDFLVFPGATKLFVFSKTQKNVTLLKDHMESLEEKSKELEKGIKDAEHQISLSEEQIIEIEKQITMLTASLGSRRITTTDDNQNNNADDEQRRRIKELEKRRKKFESQKKDAERDLKSLSSSLYSTKKSLESYKKQIETIEAQRKKKKEEAAQK